MAVKKETAKQRETRIREMLDALNLTLAELAELAKQATERES